MANAHWSLLIGHWKSAQAALHCILSTESPGALPPLATLIIHRQPETTHSHLFAGQEGGERCNVSSSGLNLIARCPRLQL